MEKFMEQGLWEDHGWDGKMKSGGKGLMQHVAPVEETKEETFKMHYNVHFSSHHNSCHYHPHFHRPLDTWSYLHLCTSNICM